MRLFFRIRRFKLNMLFKKLLPVYNATMERLIRASRFSKSEEAQFRLRVVDFSLKYE